jgi:hypothetical protein
MTAVFNSPSFIACDVFKWASMSIVTASFLKEVADTTRSRSLVSTPNSWDTSYLIESIICPTEQNRGRIEQRKNRKNQNRAEQSRERNSKIERDSVREGEKRIRDIK